MTSLEGLLALTSQLHSSESYGDLLSSRPHWLFELTLELLSAPLVFAVGWLWRNGLLRHLHRDIHDLAHDIPPECIEPTPNRRLPFLPRPHTHRVSRQDSPEAPTDSLAARAPDRHTRSLGATRRTQNAIATQHDLADLAAQVQALRNELRAATAHDRDEAPRTPRTGRTQPPT